MRKGVISQSFDLGTTALRLVSEARGVEEIEEKVAKVVFEWSRSRNLIWRRAPAIIPLPA
jgi:hypothetical protein